MPKQNLPESSFNFNVKIGEYETSDIETFYVYRMPFQKNASFASLTLSMPFQDYTYISDKIKVENKRPTIEIEIDLVDPNVEDEENPKKNKKITTIAKKKYLGFYTKPLESIDVDNKHPRVIFYLSNPILFYLQKNNSFNDIIREKKAKDALLEFEDFIKNKYGDGSFYFKKIEGEINNHNYEQMLMQAPNDLEAPNFILNNFKVYNDFSYYFFDDFRITPDFESDICGLTISFTDKERFDKKDLQYDKNSKYSDFYTSNSFKKEDAIIDPFDELNKQNPTINVDTKENDYDTEKAKGSTSAPNLNQNQPQETNVENEERKIKYGDPNLSNHETTPTEDLELYAPDNRQNAINRFEKTTEYLEQGIRELHTFENLECHPDFIQFDRIYNLDPIAENSFVFLPVSIVNIFRKKNEKELLMTHSSKYQCIRFKEEE